MRWPEPGTPGPDPQEAPGGAQGGGDGLSGSTPSPVPIDPSEGGGLPAPGPAGSEHGPWIGIAANTDLSRLVAAAADLCRRPLHHGVVQAGPAEPLECSLRLEARSPQGERLPEEDLELEIYRSGEDLNLTLAWRHDDSRPMLWQGSHPVWMDGSGRRCPPPAAGAPLEALARRLRALLAPG